MLGSRQIFSINLSLSITLAPDFFRIAVSIHPCMVSLTQRALRSLETVHVQTLCEFFSQLSFLGIDF